MNSPESVSPKPPSPEQLAMNLWIVWGALCGSLLIYGALPLFGAFPVEPPHDPAARLPILYALIGVALAELLGQYLAAGLIARRAGNIFSYFIIRWAIIESVAIYGLVSFTLLGDISITWEFIGVSLLVMLGLAPGAKQRESFERYRTGEA